MSKILAIDYGEKRIGLALSSEDEQFAFSYQTLDNSGQDVFSKLADICQVEGIKIIIIGLPLDQNGKVGKKAEEVQEFTKELQDYVKIEIEYEDERFSSALASKLLREAGRAIKGDKGAIDQKSAQLILQTYLERKNAGLSNH